MCILWGLLKECGDTLITNFDLDKIKIPTGFQPSKDMSFEEAITNSSVNTLDDLICKISNKTGYSAKEILEKIQSISSKKQVSFEIAALLICKDFRVNFDEYLEIIENIIFKNNK